MFGTSGFFGPFSTTLGPVFIFLFFLSLMRSIADLLCPRPGRGGGGRGGGGGGGGGTGAAAEASGLDPTTNETCMMISLLVTPLHMSQMLR